MEKLLLKIANENNITNYKIESTAGSKKGDGFLSKLFKFDLVSDEKTFNLIAKVSPENKEYRRQIPVKLLYDNEIYFYEKIVKAFKEIWTQNSHSAFFKSDFNLSIPKYYGSTRADCEEVLFLENLLSSNYTMWDPKLINDEHISIVLKEYGKFHAYSFAIKEQNVTVWQKLLEGMEDAPGLFFSGTDFTESVIEQCQNVVGALRSRDKIRIADKLEEFCNGKLADVMNNSSRYSDVYSIIVHGDSWCNNYMFQYEDKNNPETPTDIKMIDFQLARVGSPVIDISYLIYTCLQKDDLINLEKYLKIYYESLKEAAQKLHCNINLTFPYDVFMQHWKKFSSYGIAMAFVVLHGMVSHKHEFPDFEEIFASEKGFFRALNFISVNEEKYYDRIIDFVEHFVQNDYL